MKIQLDAIVVSRISFKKTVVTKPLWSSFLRETKVEIRAYKSRPKARE